MVEDAAGPPSRWAGMTINERLFDAGLLEAWDRAIRGRDRERAEEILGTVDIGVDDAKRVVDTALAKPRFYGF
ncbi:MAG: hypothetical protein JNM84_28675 [Planctomycetes bacterium]|nr:hypothetical protein [Planctomycetota bacterium]